MFLGDDEADKPIGLVIRDPTIEEIARTFAADMEHMAAEVDGEFIGLWSVGRTDGRLWGWLRVLVPPKDLMDRAHLVVAMKHGLAKYREPVFIVQHDAEAALLLRALRFQITDETIGERRVWVWRPPELPASENAPPLDDDHSTPLGADTH